MPGLEARQKVFEGLYILMGRYDAVHLPDVVGGGMFSCCPLHEARHARIIRIIGIGGFFIINVMAALA